VTRLAEWVGAGAAASLAVVLVSGCEFTRRERYVWDRGPGPKDDVIFCEIEDLETPRRCGNAWDGRFGRDLRNGALDLLTDQASRVGLDAINPRTVETCTVTGDEMPPEAIVFLGPTPYGGAECVDGERYDDPGMVAYGCYERCLEKFSDDDPVPTQDVLDHCGAHARPAVNASSAVGQACEKGALKKDFIDPRRFTTPVRWTNLRGVDTEGLGSNTLRRIEPTTTPADPVTEGFDTGATSEQVIRWGNAYVEFQTNELGTAKLLGVSQGADNRDWTKLDVDFGLRLTVLGRVLISRNGALVEKAPGDPVWANYQPGDRFRISLKQVDTATARVVFEQVMAPCDSWTFCMAVPIADAGTIAYPVRVDTSLKEQDGTLSDVRIVYIQNPVEGPR
jgi:hypothetical protein